MAMPPPDACISFGIAYKIPTEPYNSVLHSRTVHQGHCSLLKEFIFAYLLQMSGRLCDGHRHRYIHLSERWPLVP